ncbi:protein kinase family protein [Kitasatospora sp. NPDC002040]|uniref:protein kinase family protein n=1 Tax=Kitasatospora sp. NPDC002040 TaxID=3154661 RepID=UPI00332172CF
MTSHATRLAAHARVSAGLAGLTDRQLSALLDAATPLGTGIGGVTSRLEVDGTEVFVKRVPLTELEQRPEHRRSTANLFDLPVHYQYGVGSAGFGAWRELAVHELTTGWVLDGAQQNFPLLHHARVLPADPPPAEGLVGFLGGMDGAVAYWGGSPAIRARLTAITRATAAVVLFLEYVPHTLGDWLAGQDGAGHPWAAGQLAETTAFLRANGLVHFDAHFRNVLTDGHRLYFADFGLSLSESFELTDAEREFLDRHRGYDAAYTVAHLLNHHLPEGLAAAWAAGQRPDGTAPELAALLDRHAGTAARMGGFLTALRADKSTRYPLD